MTPRRSLLPLLLPLALRAAAPDFGREVGPILSENCFHCHGPDEKGRKAGLRLDTQAGAFQKNEHGQAGIVPGKPEESLVWKHVASADPDEVMPPPKSNRALSAAQRETLRRWIASGAEWGKHWAFEPVRKPAVPSGGHPIDALVRARLAREKLEPRPEADRRALLRRVTLDLTGLPPTPEEVDAFLADTDPGAYERVVDRLLASPRYGERMAWDWMDVARYADSNGYQGDNERTMWPWRDWVVEAFNRNLPYDQFTVWQLAGDLLPGATDEQVLATGFLRNHPINGEGGTIPEENRVNYVMDMAETAGTAWLGLTMTCCRCHDHKYDPLLQADYYRLFAFFNQTPVDGGGGNAQTPPVLETPSAEQRARIGSARAALEAARRAVDEALRSPAALAWETSVLAAPVTNAWQALKPATWKAEHQTLSPQPGDSVLAGGDNPVNDTYELTYLLPAETNAIRSLRLDALKHPTMTHGALARSDSGNFVLTELELRVDGAPVAIASAEATHEQGSFKVKGVFDGNRGTGWAVHEGRPLDREHAAVFRLKEPLAAGTNRVLHVTLRHDSPHAHHNLGHFRLSASTRAEAPLQAGPDALSAALAVPAEKRRDEQWKVVEPARAAAEPAFAALVQARDAAGRELEAARRDIPRVMVMKDMDKPRRSFVLDHGLYDQPRAEVSPNVPVSLPPLPAGVTTNRLALARWITSPENPLAARVTVNRLWQQFFGVGLVKTSEDFGVQAETPPQLDLLNWLAADFREGGWDVKRFVRQVVTSATYRQSSAAPAEAFAADPQNRLLARGPRFRMPSWMIRDQALAAAGLLSPRLGGPPVNTYQPDGVWEEATFGNKRYRRDSGESLYRRSLYVFWRRIIGPTFLFDTGNRAVCEVKPLRTNTPLHALSTLNDPAYVEAARALAEAGLAAGGGPEAFIRHAFRRVLAREPSSDELRVLAAGYERRLEGYRADPAAAAKLLAIGERKPAAGVPAPELAAATTVCLGVLNLDEALSKE